MGLEEFKKLYVWAEMYLEFNQFLNNSFKFMSSLLTGLRFNGV